MNKCNDLSLSMMIEKKQIKNDLCIPKMTPAIWIPGKNIKTCFECKTEFSMWNRKHHCRICGRIFCSTCCNNWRKVPSLVNMTTPPQSSFFPSIMTSLSDVNFKRMCSECKNKLDFIDNSSQYIYILTNMPLTIRELLELRVLNKKWCKSVTTVITFYKCLQYKLVCQKFSKIEKRLLWNHKLEFKGHFQLISKFISCFNEEKYINRIESTLRKYDNVEKFSCRVLACNRNCSKKPKLEELIDIYSNQYFLKNNYCRSWLESKLRELSKDKIILIFPWLLRIAIDNTVLFDELIFPLCCDNEVLIYSTYFELKQYMSDIILKEKLYNRYLRFLTVIGERNLLEVRKVNDFIKLINFNAKAKSSLVEWEKKFTKWFNKYQYFNIPWNPKIKCVGVEIEGIHCFRSATKPWKIPLIVRYKNKEKLLNILVKFEDVRKDKLTMTISKMLNKVCKNITNIKTYNVFPITTNNGWIEMIDEAQTLYDIKYKYNTTLQNYIMDFNPNLTIIEMREKFIKTCVSSCVLCYVLGVGDRHLENILVTKNGDLCHIDFSYLLGNDPKKQLAPTVRITDGMLNMLGGNNSDSFKKFKKKCQKAYKLIRSRSSLWFVLLKYLNFAMPTIDNFKYGIKEIKDHVIERLVPGENDSEASMQIVQILDRSSHENWRYGLAEWSHSIGNELRKIKENVFIFNMDF